MTTDIKQALDGAPWGRSNPFTVDVSQSKLDDIMRRVAGYRFMDPPSDEGDSWKYGVNSKWLEALRDYWVGDYDWRKMERRLNEYLQYQTRVQGVPLHFVEVIGEAQGTRPLVLLHGWPGTHFEFWNVIDELAFPSKSGGSAGDAFDLIIVSLPGFGFSPSPREPVGLRRIAALVNDLMVNGLGYPNYMVQGGDQGAGVATWLGNDFSDYCKAIHVNLIGWRPSLDDDGASNADEHKVLQETLLDEIPDLAYCLQHMTRPQTLALGLNDSPVGAAAWLLDKVHDWTDLSQRSIDEVYDRDRLLTLVMIYLVNDAIRTSLWSYVGLLEDPARLSDGPYCATPVAMLKLPHEVVGFTPPRPWVERYYNIVRWTELDAGGHFAAMERPAEFVEDLRKYASEIGY